jgi:hypothetical protein
MEDPIYVLKRKKDFPIPQQFQEKYIQITDFSDPSNNFAEKKVIILYKYAAPLFGNYEKEFMYHGTLYKIDTNHIGIQDYNKGAPVFLSKKRFKNRFELYIEK